jgi:hypothetical protein
LVQYIFLMGSLIRELVLDFKGAFTSLLLLVRSAGLMTNSPRILKYWFLHQD